MNETDWDDRVCFYFIVIRIKNEICLSVLDSKKEMNWGQNWAYKIGNHALSNVISSAPFELNSFLYIAKKKKIYILLSVDSKLDVSYI